MGRALCFALGTPVLAAILALAHAPHCRTGSGGFTGAVLPVLLLGIVTGPVIQLFMLIAADLRTHGTCSCAGCRAAHPATDVGIAGCRGAVRGIGGDGIAIIDVQLHLLAALAFQRYH